MPQPQAELSDSDDGAEVAWQVGQDARAASHPSTQAAWNPWTHSDALAAFQVGQADGAVRFRLNAGAGGGPGRELGLLLLRRSRRRLPMRA